MKPRVYIETTIPSYLTARPSRDLLRAAHQQITREWWDQRAAFELYVSPMVLVECQAGDLLAAGERLAALSGLPLLEPTDSATSLADELVRAIQMPPKAVTDALHIATAAVHRMRFC